MRKRQPGESQLSTPRPDSPTPTGRQDYEDLRTILHLFTDRDEPRAIFHRHLNAPAGTTLPVLMFYGVGGIGKTWLQQFLRHGLSQREGEPPIPSARLDFDIRGERSGAYKNDWTEALAAIRTQLGVECPRFDLALAMLRHKQGERELPNALKGSETGKVAWDVVATVASSGIESVAFGTGGILTALARKGAERFADRHIKDSRLGRWLTGALGNQDFLDLRAMDAQAIAATLSRRLGLDLESGLPARPGRACQAVVFLDTFEAFHTDSSANDERRRTAEERVCDLYEELTNVLLVISGQNRLTWDTDGRDVEWAKSEHLEQHLVGNLSKKDARTILHKESISDGELQKAILGVCVAPDTTTGEHGYYPDTLGLCATAVRAEKARTGQDPEPSSFDLPPDNYGVIADRFLKALSQTYVTWVTTLALPPRFDETTARALFSDTWSQEQDVAWNALRSYSFLQPAGEPGWFTFHAKMQDALRRRVVQSPERWEREHRLCQAHFMGRSQEPTDNLAGLAWFHEFQVEPDSAVQRWITIAQQARQKLQMGAQFNLFSWIEPTGIESRLLTSMGDAAFLNAIGIELCQSSLGNRGAILRRAITCFSHALEGCSKTDFPYSWAMTQNNLANASCQLGRIRDPEDNLTKAIECYERALEVYQKKDFPQDWAMAQNNMGLAYSDLAQVTQSDKTLKRALDCCEQALEVRTLLTFPLGFAQTSRVKGNILFLLNRRQEGLQAFKDVLEGFAAGGDHVSRERLLAELEATEFAKTSN